MTIPASNDARRPILEYLAQAQEPVKLARIIEVMAEHFELTKEEREDRVATGMKRFDARITTATAKLKQERLLLSPRHSYLEITEKGRDEANKTLQAKREVHEPTPAPTPTPPPMPAAPVSDKDDKAFQEILKTYLANNDVKPEELPQVGRALREMLSNR